MTTLTLLPICVTVQSFPHHTISKLRKPITMNEDCFWEEYIDQARWCVVDGLKIKAYGFSYDGWRVIDEPARRQTA